MSSDRLGGYLILGSVAGIMVPAFVIYQYGLSIYRPLQQITTLNSALQQLQATQPLVPTIIVDGEFTVTHSAEEHPLFVERFSDKPRRVDFRLTVPSAPELSRIISIGRTHLRVFGTVLKPLGDDGVIELRPIAVF